MRQIQRLQERYKPAEPGQSRGAKAGGSADGEDLRARAEHRRAGPRIAIGRLLRCSRSSVALPPAGPLSRPPAGL